MTEEFQTHKTPDVINEACAWIAQLETGDMTSQDLTAFREWMARSPAHRKEIRRLAYLSQDLNILTNMAAPLKEAADHHRKAITNSSHSKWGTARRFATAIFMVGFILSGVFFLLDNNAPSDELHLIKTSIGKHREVTLSDGTILKLNTNSEIEIDYKPDYRKVRLIKGEAFFQVAHNADRPFIVYAGLNSIRAIGTAFVVSLLPKKFEVTVTEGRVELAHTPTLEQAIEPKVSTPKEQIQERQEASLASISIGAGESVSYTDITQNKVIEVVSKREIERKLSWQQGLLDFYDMPLVEVIEDLNRYTSLRIEISDPELRYLKFGGIFRTNELHALFNALETTFNIKVDYVGDDVVRLSRNRDDTT